MKMPKDRTPLIKEFIQHGGLMGRAKYMIVNQYMIPASEAEGLIFEALAVASEWYEEDGNASWNTAVFTVLHTVCLCFKRKHKQDYRFINIEGHQDDRVFDVETSKYLHFKNLLDKVTERIYAIPTPEMRELMISVLLYGDRYDYVAKNTPANRKAVERFRTELIQEFGEEMRW